MDINGLSGLIRMNGYIYIYTLWETNIAIENGHLWLIYPLKMVIFHSYVRLPEGKPPRSSHHIPVKNPWNVTIPGFVAFAEVPSVCHGNQSRAGGRLQGGFCGENFG
jgi:hypothetical protein